MSRLNDMPCVTQAENMKANRHLSRRCNCVPFFTDSSAEYKTKVMNYVADVKYRFWRSCAFAAESSAASEDSFKANQDSSVVT